MIHFGQECVQTNLSLSDEFSAQNLSLQQVIQEPDEPYQWATSRKSGRPHPKESRELDLVKGERIKVFQDMGRDWFIALGRKNVKGWVHRSWLRFGDPKLHGNPSSIPIAYKRFQEDLQKMLKPGQLSSFPPMAEYVNDCNRHDCQARKEEVSSVGICIHDLNILLEGSGSYSYEWLKEGRNVWHPDRFARFCQSGYAEGLKPKAEQVFVLYGILMDACKA